MAGTGNWKWKLDVITVLLHDKLTRLPLIHLHYFFLSWRGVTSHPLSPPWIRPCRAVPLLKGGAENAGRENDGREIDGPICRA